MVPYTGLTLPTATARASSGTGYMNCQCTTHRTTSQRVSHSHTTTSQRVSHNQSTCVPQPHHNQSTCVPRPHHNQSTCVPRPHHNQSTVCPTAPLKSTVSSAKRDINKYCVERKGREPMWPSGKALSPFLIGRMFLREAGWKYSAKLVGSQLGQLFFANLVGSIRRSYIRGPKSFAQHVLGTFALLDDHCL